MPIAMQTRSSEIADVVLTAIHLCFPVFNCRHGVAILGERPAAIATLVTLLLDVFLQCPPAIFWIHHLYIGVNRDSNK